MAAQTTYKIIKDAGLVRVEDCSSDDSAVPVPVRQKVPSFPRFSDSDNEEFLKLFKFALREADDSNLKDWSSQTIKMNGKELLVWEPQAMPPDIDDDADDDDDDDDDDQEDAAEVMDADVMAVCNDKLTEQQDKPEPLVFDYGLREFLVDMEKMQREPRPDKHKHCRHKQKQPLKDVQVESKPSLASSADNVEYLQIGAAGDFRSYFELDTQSLKLLRKVAKPATKKSTTTFSMRIVKYLKHFYNACARKDHPYFLWPVCEGYYATQLLLTKKKLLKLKHDVLDKRVVRYIKKKKKQPLTEQRVTLHVTEIQAQYMICSYCRILYERSKAKSLPQQDRLSLRARFAASNIELFMLESNEREFNCLQFFNWTKLNERRLFALYESTLQAARARAKLAAEKRFVKRTPNIGAITDFYERGIIPQFDVKSTSKWPRTYRSYELPTTAAAAEGFRCPLDNCKCTINDLSLLAHFLNAHCRLLQELWLKDRLVLVMHPYTYTAEGTYCLFVLPLLREQPSSQLPLPTQIRNRDLPPFHLYFAQHLPCLLMLSIVSRQRLLDPQNTADFKANCVYIFWLASTSNYPSNLGARIYIYSRTHSTYNSGMCTLDFIKLNEFHNISDFLQRFEGNYMALDIAALAELTKNFTELFFLDIRYIDKQEYKSDESGEEHKWRFSVSMDAASSNDK
ncbi:uncharacterized protein LOC108602081 [Drosophila busckii]|uniref:uncharacterized protein LOC108602081 n=1 Tax=Drosophila busckii TaxID=30019 RepID=UPI00083F3452|nr:uncharacterized protein LOC108602081 [Drosophila busckii]